VIGLLGLVDELRSPPPGTGWHDGDTVLVLGDRRAAGARPYPLGGSRWAVERFGHRAGTLAPLVEAAQRRVVDLVTSVVAEGVAGGPALLTGVHDVSGGGLAVALAEMATPRGIGARLTGIDGVAELFTELPGRFVVAVAGDAAKDELAARAAGAGVPWAVLGTAGGDRLVATGDGTDLVDIGLDVLTARWSGALPGALGEPD
jgi:phosphoribosylformylglycinamidine synthase